MRVAEGRPSGESGHICRGPAPSSRFLKLGDTIHASVPGRLEALFAAAPTLSFGHGDPRYSFFRKKRLPLLRRVLPQGKWSSMSDDRKLAVGRLPEQVALVNVPRASEATSVYGVFVSHFQRPPSPWRSFRDARVTSWAGH
jgi:hypothetical protein